MFTAVSWAIGSQIQGRMRNANRPLLVALGLALLAIAGIGMALVAARDLPGWAAFAVWPIAGLGAGFALTSSSVVLLEATNDADRGSDSASLQLADSSMSALCTAFSGALVASAAHGRISYGAGLAIVYLVMSALGLAAIARASRLRRPVGSEEPEHASAAAVGPSLAAP
jgi:MFS family permease